MVVSSWLIMGSDSSNLQKDNSCSYEFQFIVKTAWYLGEYRLFPFFKLSNKVIVDFSSKTTGLWVIIVLETWTRATLPATECKFCHNPSPSRSPKSKKSKVERNWSDSILLCHHHISACATPYLRLRPPTQTFLSNQTSNWAQIFTVNLHSQDKLI